MNTLLWTLIGAGALNTLAILFCFYLGDGLPPMANWARLVDALYTAILAVWAVILLVKQP